MMCYFAGKSCLLSVSTYSITVEISLRLLQALLCKSLDGQINLGDDCNCEMFQPIRKRSLPVSSQFHKE